MMEYNQNSIRIFRNGYEIKPYAELEKADLSEVSLYGLKLLLINLQEAKLNNSDLNKTTFYGVNLTGANLQKACFSESYLRSVNFSGADLRGIDFRFTQFRDCNIVDSKIKGMIIDDGEGNEYIIG